MSLSILVSSVCMPSSWTAGLYDSSISSFLKNLHTVLGFPGGSDGKSVCLQCRRPGFDPWVGKIPWRRKWQPTPLLLPGKSHGQRSLVGYSPWGHKESDTTEGLYFHWVRFYTKILSNLLNNLIVLIMNRSWSLREAK